MSLSIACLSRRTPFASLAAALASTLALGGSAIAGGVPACDERDPINLPTSFPWNTICTLRYDADYDGILGAVGSGVLITPYTVLTAGHCVYNRNEGHYNYSDIHVQPAAYLNGATITYPYGTRIADHKHTNSRWADLSYTAKGDVDYGCLHLICPFEELDTFVPLRFEYSPSLVNMAGYPVEDLPDSSRTYDMWFDAGDVTDVDDRQLEYDTRSTGGASGAPVWVLFGDTGERYVVAVNRAHNTECNGLGCRLVDQNEDLIRDWMDYEPTFAEKLAAGCAFELVAMPFSGLINFYLEHPQQLFSAEALRLTNPSQNPGEPSARMFQIIGNTFYEWEEFQIEPGSPNTQRFLRMVSPQQQWLNVNQARVLLTASIKWAGNVPGQGNEETAPNTGGFPFPNPVDQMPFGGPSPATPDLPGPIDTGPCIGDLNGDGTVNGADLAILLGAWGQPGGIANLDGNGQVNGADLAILLGAWGPC
jgi:V8-like Glu-specific endopeptidase